MLKRLCLLSLVSISLCTSAYADVGVSAFAMLHSKFPCEDYLRLFRYSPVAFTSILIGTFGNNKRCLKKFLRLKKKKIVQIHVSNEAGRRNGKLLAGELLPQYSISQYGKAWEGLSPKAINSLLLRVEPYASLTKDYPDVEWLISDGLESNDSITAAKNRIATLRKKWPHKIVHAPLHARRKWRDTGADAIELHGLSPKLSMPCISNLDGADIDFKDGRGSATRGISADEVPSYIRKYKHRGCKVLLWWSSLQGTRQGWKPPFEREFKIFSEQSSSVKKWLRRYNEGQT